MKIFKNSWVATAFLLLSVCYNAQTETPKTTTETQPTAVNPAPENIPLAKKITLNALLVGDYGVSLTDNVDINGKHYEAGAPSNNGFYLKYVRFQTKMDLTKDITAQVLVNLADFKENPQTKVLEIATIKYKYNNYANFQLGQFRPYFGAEDLYSFDTHRSYNWSNQYSLFGKNNWQSFQLGAAFFGSLEDQKIPLKYFYTFSNANGKNQQGDSNNSKTHSFRLEYRPVKGLTLAANSAFGRSYSEPINAYGADFSYETNLNEKWLFGIDGEYKQGSNMVAYAASKLVDKRMDNFRMQGAYVTPLIRFYTGNKKFFDAVELSCRYEYLEDLMENGNPSRSYVPMLSFIIGNTYQSRLSLIGAITNYNRQVANTTQWNNNQFVVQYQFRY